MAADSTQCDPRAGKKRKKTETGDTMNKKLRKTSGRKGKVMKYMYGWAEQVHFGLTCTSLAVSLMVRKCRIAKHEHVHFQKHNYI